MVMSERLRTFAILAIAVAALSLSIASASQTPTTEARSIRRIDQYAHAAAFLNLAQGTVRIVTIVPTQSSSSLSVIDTVAAILRSNPSKRLRAYFILHGESDTALPLQAAVIAGRASDPRIVYFWDPTGAVAQMWEPGNRGGAWLYDTSAKFSDRPPTASLIVAVPAGSASTLEGASLRATSAEFVRRVEAKMERPDGAAQ
jgi:hypothetical protein